MAIHSTTQFGNAFEKAVPLETLEQDKYRKHNWVVPTLMGAISGFDLVRVFPHNLFAKVTSSSSTSTHRRSIPRLMVRCLVSTQLAMWVVSREWSRSMVACGMPVSVWTACRGTPFRSIKMQRTLRMRWLLNEWGWKGRSFCCSFSFHSLSNCK